MQMSPRLGTVADGPAAASTPLREGMQSQAEPTTPTETTPTHLDDGGRHQVREMNHW